MGSEDPRDQVIREQRERISELEEGLKWIRFDMNANVYEKADFISRVNKLLRTSTPVSSMEFPDES